MPIETISPRRLYQQVADQLLALIDSGEFPVGSRLPTERELAAKLGLSRPTVREALIALEVHGRVRIRVGSGIYVLPRPEAPSLPEQTHASGPFEILEARAVIEGALAEQAALRATAADVAALDAILAAAEEALGTGEEMLAIDRQFHVTVAAILQNDAIVHVVRDLFDQRMNPYFEQLASYFENAATWRTAWVEHRAVRDAIASRDAAGARAAMCRHLEQSKLRFSNTFKPVVDKERARRASPQPALPTRRQTAGLSA